MISGIKEILEKQKGKSRASRVIKNLSLLALWKDIAGKEVAQRTEAIKISGKILLVKTPNPTWSQQLSQLRGEYVQKFNQAAGSPVIKDIRFKITI